MTTSLSEARRAARVLRAELPDLSDGQALEIVAHRLGHRDWTTAAARLAGGMGGVVPVLRMLDVPSAHAFYLDHLGFAVEWEHRFEPGLPLYTRIRRDDLVLDLSEHPGDGTPGSGVWVPVADVHALDRELSARNYRGRPDVDEHAPGGPTLAVVGPFANVIRFCQVADG